MAEKRSGTRWGYLDVVVFRSKTASGQGRVANLSAGGLFVRTNRTPALGELVHLTLQGTSPPLELEGHVRWTGSPREGTGGFGAQLVAPPTAYREIIRSLASVGSVDRGLRRTSPRLEISIPVGLEFESCCDEGILCDISLSGARLEGTALQPGLGTQVVLTFAVQGNRRPFEVEARVVRVTPDGGYAVEFEAVDPRLKAGLEHVYAFIRKLPDI
jgi:Tfp pilus assembly protein PilZ